MNVFHRFNRKYLSATVATVGAIIVFLFLFATVPAAVNAQATATPTLTLTPTNTPTLTPTPIATALANTSGNGLVQYLRCGSYSFGLVTPGACVSVFNGSDVEMFSSTGRRTFYVDGETGNTTIYGTMAQGSATGYKCVDGSQSVTGSATVVPGTLTGAGIATPVVMLATLNTASTGDLHHTSAVTSGGGVTLQVWNSALTPVAASGAATVGFHICGN